MNTAATGESQTAVVKGVQSGEKPDAEKVAVAADESPQPGWQLHSSQLSSDAQDPLLGCLVNLTRFFGSPQSPESLITGLPWKTAG